MTAQTIEHVDITVKFTCPSDQVKNILPWGS